MPFTSAFVMPGFSCRRVLRDVVALLDVDLVHAAGGSEREEEEAMKRMANRSGDSRAL
jgi:hypothetical protein